MKQKDKLLIQLIKSVPSDKPSPDFTENVMDYLKEGQTLLKENDFIHQYNFKKEILHDVSVDFTHKTMKALRDKVEKPTLEPLSSTKANTVLISIMSIIYICLLLDGLFFNTIQVSEKTWLKIAWFQDLFIIPPVFWVSVVTLAALLFMDSLIKKIKISF